MPQQTKIFRVFVSSTFTDMTLERGILQRDAFPRLEKFCEEAGAKFQAVDLRWGINEESSFNQKTLQICFNEVARCQKISPKPNFLILLGDKYGWQPIPEIIPGNEMQAILGTLTGTDRELIEKWYRCDENAVTGTNSEFHEYILQPKGNELRNYDDWAPVESLILKTFREAVTNLNFTPGQNLKYFTSATHQEIISGALNPPAETESPEKHVFCFSRTIQDLPAGRAARGFIDLREDGTIDHESHSKLDGLKKELLRKIGISQFINYAGEWVDGTLKIKEDALKRFNDSVFDKLKKIIDAQLADVIDKDEITHEIKLQKDFGNRLTEHFRGREEILEKISIYINNPNERRIMSLIGKSGSGKSSVIAEAARLNEGTGSLLVYRFIGTSSPSSNVVSLLQSVCGQIAKYFNIEAKALGNEGDEKAWYDINGLIQIFGNCLSLATNEKPLLLLLDSLDQLSDTDQGRDLYWLPKEIPDNVHFIVSSLPELEENLNGTYIEYLKELPETDALQILDRWFKSIKRTLTYDQKTLILSNFRNSGLPIYLKLAFEKARHWHSYDGAHSLKPHVNGIINEYFDDLEKEYPEDFVKTAVCYLLSGRYQGLAENEILEVLAFDPEYWDKFIETTHPDHRRELINLKSELENPLSGSKGYMKIPIAVWSRLYLELEPFLAERDADGVPVITFFHRQFNEVLKKRYGLIGEQTENSTNEEFRSAIRYNYVLSPYFITKPLYLDDTIKEKPNVRKLVEQPWQQTKAEMWDEVADDLCDLNFIEAKCIAGMTYDLIRDFELLLIYIPENRNRYIEEQEHKQRVNKWINESIIYARKCSERRDLQMFRQPLNEFEPVLPEPPNSCRLWTDEEIESEHERLIDHPTIIDKLNFFYGFVFIESYALNENNRQKGFIIQHAFNYSPDGLIHDIANKIIRSVNEPLIIRKWPVNFFNGNYNTPAKYIHTPSACYISVTPDRRLAVIANLNNTLQVINIETGIYIHELKGHEDAVTCACITPDGGKAVSGSKDGTLRVWNLKNGECLLVLRGHTDSVLSVSITPDGRIVASGSRDCTVRIWDLGLKFCLRVLNGHQEEVSSVSISQDGRIVVSADYLSLRIWDYENGICLHDLAKSRPSMPSTILSITTNGRYVVSDGGGNKLIVWDIFRGTKVRTLETEYPNSSLTCVCVTTDCALVVSASLDNKIYVWDFHSGEQLKLIHVSTGWAYNITVSADGRFATYCSDNGMVVVCDIEKGSNQLLSQKHTNRISDLTITPDGKLALSASLDHSIGVWDIETGSFIRFLKGHTKRITSLAVSNDSKKVISASWDNTLISWDLINGKCLEVFKGHTKPVTTVAITSDDKYIVSGSFDETIRLWSLKSGLCYRIIEGQSKGVAKLMIAPNNKHTVSLCYDKTVHICNLKKNKQIRILGDEDNLITDLTLSNNGKYVVTEGGYSYASVWDLMSGKHRRDLIGHNDLILSEIISSDNKYVITSGKDKTVRRWDIKTGKGQQILQGHLDWISSLKMIPDSHCIISISHDKTIKIWDFEKKVCLSTLFLWTSNPCISITKENDLIVGTNYGEILFYKLQNIILR